VPKRQAEARAAGLKGKPSYTKHMLWSNHLQSLQLVHLITKVGIYFLEFLVYTNNLRSSKPTC
jgi:hypothetical protein